MKNLRMSKMVPVVLVCLAIIGIGLSRKEKPVAVSVEHEPAPVQVAQVRPEPEVIAAPIVSVPEVPVQAPVAVETGKVVHIVFHPNFTDKTPMLVTNRNQVAVQK